METFDKRFTPVESRRQTLVDQLDLVGLKLKVYMATFLILWFELARLTKVNDQNCDSNRTKVSNLCVEWFKCRLTMITVP